MTTIQSAAMTDREQFEAAYLLFHPAALSAKTMFERRDVGGDDGYAMLRVQGAWEGWQLAARPVTPAPDTAPMYLALMAAHEALEIVNMVPTCRSGASLRAFRLADQVLNAAPSHCSAEPPLCASCRGSGGKPPFLCSQCGGLGVVPIGDGYSVDGCPACHPLADQYTAGYEHGHADATREAIEDADCSSHEEDAAWSLYNTKNNWGHEPTAKGLFIDGHRAASTSIAKDAARYRYVLKHGVPFSRDVSYSDEQTDWLIDKALGCAVGDFSKRNDE